MADTCHKNQYERAATRTICLRSIYDPKPVPKAPVPIRPPPPRPPCTNTKPQTPKSEPNIEPPAKPIMRKRAKSMSSFLTPDRTPQHKGSQVRFVDALGLELEEVKVFRVQEHPQIPHHVMFRLTMSSEMAFGKWPELSLPYFKACFQEEQRSQPDFMERLHSQRSVWRKFTAPIKE
ncbi:hypothetical protein WMY93_019832 [Mugilogobius chulae]|uniref:Uncharacterized protein n=1 Tax=Mugilogobius chulae TaxID=88201 RepID=A0AAW0NJM9_9GOBI